MPYQNFGATPYVVLNSLALTLKYRFYIGQCWIHRETTFLSSVRIDRLMNGIFRRRLAKNRQQILTLTEPAIFLLPAPVT